MMKVLCFGDSNTYGYDPCSFLGGRYPEQFRWVDLLGVNAINAGQNGREIPDRAGVLERLLEIHRPDLLVIMLGTNDLLKGLDPSQVCAEMERFLYGIPFARSRILLVSPPVMKLGAWVPSRDLVDASRELAGHYKELAGCLGVRFAEAGECALTYDGVHLTEEGHVSLAGKLSCQMRSDSNDEF